MSRRPEGTSVGTLAARRIDPFGAAFSDETHASSWQPPGARDLDVECAMEHGGAGAP